MSKNKNRPNKVTEPITEMKEDISQVEETPVTEEVKEEIPVEVKIEPEIVDAVVDGVNNMLNVRSTPRVEEDNVVTTIKNGTKIKVVDPKKATREWFKIIITDKDKTEGFAMKKYIKII